MSESLSWEKRKKKSDKEAPPGIAGMIFGSLMGVVLVFVDSTLLNGMFLGKAYNFLVNLFPYAISSIIPRWFIWIIIPFLFMVLGILIELYGGDK